MQNAEQDNEPPATECSRIRDGDIHKTFVAGLAEGDVGVSVADFARSKLLAPPLTTHRSCNASTPEPQTGMHCQIIGEVAIGAPSAEGTAEQCRQRCCNTDGCSCWTWTTYERDDAPPCKKGGDCCWLKWQPKPLIAAVNCTGGTVPGRFRPPQPGPPPPPPAPQDPCVQAGKAWFFTQNVTLALGTDIRRGTTCIDMPLTTSLQQSNLFGPVWTGDGAHQASMLPNNTNVTLNLTATASSDRRYMYWVWHDGLAYVILVSGDVNSTSSLTVSNQVREGDREHIIESGTNATIYKQVFTAFMNHPSSSVDTSYTYTYAIVPSPSVAATDALLSRLFGPHAEVTVVSNKKPLQVVCTREQLMQIIVWPASTGAAVSADKQVHGVIHGGAAGCWEISVTFNNTAAAAAGALLQLRATTLGAVAISAVAPPVRTAAQGRGAVTIYVTGLALHGDACSVAGGGTEITVGLNSTGATNVVHCQSAEGL